jgi:predicted RNA-binding Zn-ribbon protein involved in translation (DUF1610 family)
VSAITRKIDMYDPVKPPRCTSCGRLIEPGSVAVSFPCPSCGQVTIWRCAKCRRQGSTYTCPNCGFTGP